MGSGARLEGVGVDKGIVRLSVACEVVGVGAGCWLGVVRQCLGRTSRGWASTENRCRRGSSRSSWEDNGV